VGVPESGPIDLYTIANRPTLLAASWNLKTRCGSKKVVLELGGNAACIVDRDQRDRLDHVVSRLMFGGFYQSGQSCIHVQRVIAHADINDELKAKYVAAAKALVMDDPKHEDTFIGPMIRDGEAKRLHGWIQQAAAAAGGKILCGGKRNGAMPVEGTASAGGGDMSLQSKASRRLSGTLLAAECSCSGYTSSGRNPVCFAIRASMRGPISSPGWKANT
jgi:hypothetical protein